MEKQEENALISAGMRLGSKLELSEQDVIDLLAEVIAAKAERREPFDLGLVVEVTELMLSGFRQARQMLDAEDL